MVRRRISFAVPMASSALATTWAARARFISSARLRLEQLGVREDDAELVVQAMKEERSSGDSSIGLLASSSSTLSDRHQTRFRPSACPHASTAGRSGVRIAPQRVDEDANRTAGGAHVFDFAAGEPVVDGAPADADELTRLHDRNRFSFHLAACLRGLYRTSRRSCRYADVTTGVACCIDRPSAARQRRPQVSTCWRPR